MVLHPSLHSCTHPVPASSALDIDLHGKKHGFRRNCDIHSTQRYLRQHQQQRRQQREQQRQQRQQQQRQQRPAAAAAAATPVT